MRVSPSGSVALKSKTKVWFSGIDRFPSDWKAGAWLGADPEEPPVSRGNPLESLKSNWARLPFAPESRVSRGNPAESPESVLISPFSPPVSSGKPGESEKPLRIGSFVSSSKPPESLKSL